MASGDKESFSRKPDSRRGSGSKHRKSTQQPQTSGWFTTPAPIRRLFAAFPVQTLPANTLPASSTSISSDSGISEASKTTLYVFTSPEDAKNGSPSFNPSCLKWQTWLYLQGVQVQTVPSNNHSSPSGSLPFLLPKENTGEGKGKPIHGGSLYKWAQEHGRGRESELRPEDAMREEAYLSLIEHRIRAAWLHNLYLTANFNNIVYPLYISPCSSVGPVRASLAASLRVAARQSLHHLSPRTSPSLDGSISAAYYSLFNAELDSEAKALYKHSADAFVAMSTLLGDDEWFFGSQEPGLLDVSLFAYTHLLLDDDLGDGWADTRVRRGLTECNNLVRHRKRLYKRCYA